ncbi:XRE family transcriptional regulator [Streptomyces sp. GESEQ-35]|uniref:helix-turn-helix domain-containing protein n=1 Tax=Streptomyces sp. GESEQ-35 TaxID=2812657 RepID=UPI001B33B345|nr:XRE family transcriptional regulator [Streptomyces sp. GESEQ-35]
MTAQHTRLVAVLRELRARTGLSLAALSERTAYSKSSWERYLNGKSLPPRQAVQELCRVANEPEGRALRALALWEIAESDWSGRAAVLAPAAAAVPVPATDGPRPRPGQQPQPQPQEPPQPPETRRPRRRRGRLMVALVSAYTVIVGGVALVLFLLPDRNAPEDESLSASAPYSLAPQCHGASCEGRDPMRLVCGFAPDNLTTYRTATGAHVELRHSEKCGASWARVWGARIGDRVEVTAGGPTHDVSIEDSADTETYVYTEMTAAHPGSTVRACFRPASADGERECVEARVGGAATTTRPPSPQ